MPNTVTVAFTQPPADVSNSTVTVSPSSVVADGTAAATITVTLKDVNGAVVPGRTLSLSQTGRSIIAPPATVSDTKGVCLFAAADAHAETVTYTVFDATDLLNLNQTVSVSFTAPTVTPDVLDVETNKTSVPADGNSKATLTVAVTDNSGHPVAGKTVKLTPGAGTSVIAPATAVSDAAGNATFTVEDATSETVTYIVSEVS